MITHLTYLHCDGNPKLCPLRSEAYDCAPPIGRTGEKQRREARERYGWTRKGSKDYCPTCSEREKDK